MNTRRMMSLVLAALATVSSVSSGMCTEHKLIKMVANDGLYGAIGAAGTYQIDSEAVTCPSTSGCTVAFNFMATMGPSNTTCNSTGTDEWGYYIGVDGTNTGFGTNGAPMPGANQELNQSWQGIVSVPTGSHSVQMFVSVNEPCYLLYWSANYSILNK